MTTEEQATLERIRARVQKNFDILSGRVHPLSSYQVGKLDAYEMVLWIFEEELKAQPAQQDAPAFKVGDKVIHKRYQTEGIVERIALMAQVSFGDDMRILYRPADLERIEGEESEVR